MEADKPKTTHPAYPKASKKKDASAWRCKECHGWDNMGKDGVYAKGSHYTGIKGVRAMAGMDVNKIHDNIMDKTHALKGKMPHSAMEKLALFLSKGQVDNDKYIDRKNKAVRGNAKRGAAIFQTVCAVCHGYDGKEINFKDPPKAEYVGTVCKKNPVGRPAQDPLRPARRRHGGLDRARHRYCGGYPGLLSDATGQIEGYKKKTGCLIMILDGSPKGEKARGLKGNTEGPTPEGAFNRGCPRNCRR